jgi:septum formation protein
VARGERVVGQTWTTEVYFDNLPAEIIDAYIASNEWEGKSGSFGVEGMAGSLIKSINGDFYNVVGLPLNGVCRMLIEVLQEPGEAS